MGWTPPADAEEVKAWTPPVDAEETVSTKPKQPPSLVAQMFGLGSPVASFVKGAVVDPLLGVNQILANTGLFGEETKRGANLLAKKYEEASKTAREAQGREGFDWFGLTGAIASPVSKIGQGTKAATTSANIARTALIGGTQAATAPVTSGDDFWAEKTKQFALGATLGPTAEYGIKAIGGLSQQSKKLFAGLSAEGRAEAMRKHLKELAGDNFDDVVKALQDAKELVSGSRPTVSEALADIPSAADLVAAQAKLASKQGLAGKFAERTSEQQAARVRVLQQIAGTEAQRTAVQTTRDRVTGALREKALTSADVAGNAVADINDQVMGQASRIIKQSETMSGLPYPKGNLDLQGEAQLIREGASDVAAQLKKHQLQSLEQVGVFPLYTKDIVSKIDAAMKGTDSDVSKQLLGAFKEKLLEKTNADGFIKSSDLYQNVRKVTNQDIAKLLNLGDQYASGGIPQEAAKTAGNVKKFIDAALDKSSNGVWSKYLTNYQGYSNKLNRMEVGEYLSKKLQTPLDKERAGVFAAAVEDAATTIKRSTGIPRFEKLSEVMTPKEVSAINNVLADLTRKTKADQLSGLTGTIEGGLINPSAVTPGLLSRTVTVAKEAMTLLHQGNQKAFNQKMAELMLDPAAMAKFMTETVPKGKTAEFTSALMKVMEPGTRNAFIQAFAIQE